MRKKFRESTDDRVRVLALIMVLRPTLRPCRCTFFAGLSRDAVAVFKEPLELPAHEPTAQKSAQKAQREFVVDFVDQY